MAMPIAEHEVGVATGHDQRDQRKGRLFDPRAGFEPVGVDVPFEMVDAQQRLVQGERQALGDIDADE